MSKNYNKVQDDLRDVYLRAARVDSKKRILFVGPYTSRVSFASQQRRAFNIVWAAAQSQLIAEGKRVAVIGGGIAGITAAAALLSLKCIVHIYECRPELLDIQARTKHRFIHPSIAFWPDVPLQDTTELPMFDWYQSSCDTVLDLIRQEWESVFAPYANEVFLGEEVVDVVDDPDKQKVTVQTNNGHSRSDEYDCLIVATGFGSEVIVEGADNITYWAEDYLTKAGEKGESILVSGLGDGAIIDVLRSVHRDFDKGRLCLTIAGDLDRTGIKERIRQIEATLSHHGGLEPAERSERYSTEYTRILADCPPLVLRKLEASLSSRREPVQLYGRLPQPYSDYVAPIHKLLLCHGLEKNAIHFIQGELLDGPKVRLLPRKKGARAKAAAVKHCIARHGPARPSPLGLSDAEAHELRQNQENIFDLLQSIPFGSAFWVGLPGVPPCDPTCLKFATSRYSKARQYMFEEFEINLEMVRTEAGANYAYNAPDNSRADSRTLPSTLFGIAVRQTPPRMARDYAASD